ncbi:MAG: hypothetical protein IPJ71_06420 [Bdellovibrionales bacterium]|nr:hypothetical protein [Bdellovibrionales bacterium]
MTKVSRWLILIVTTIPMLLSFQNCGDRYLPKVHIASQKSDIKFSKLNAVRKVEANCLSGSSYLCRINRYSPGLADGRRVNHVCVSVENNEVCVDGDDWSYDSSEALQFCPDCSAADGLPGGRYDYAEIACSFGDEAKIYSRAESSEAKIEEYLKTSVELCLFEARQQIR